MCLGQSAGQCESAPNHLGVCFLSLYPSERSSRIVDPVIRCMGSQSDLRGCNINLSLTCGFNVSSLLRNTNGFKGNIQFGVHIAAVKRNNREEIVLCCFPGLPYSISSVSTLDAVPCGRFRPTDSLSFQNPLFQPNDWQENLCKFSVQAPVAKTSAVL